MRGQDKIQPSRVARRIAGDLWPDVQSQERIAKGVYWFSCAGHGGIVAVVGVADIPVRALALARHHGKTELVAESFGRLYTSERYTRPSFDRFRELGHPVWEVWVGEEDCDWALLALTMPAVVPGLNAQRYVTSPMEPSYPRENAERWNPGFVAEWDGIAMPVPGAGPRVLAGSVV